jgi:hypothetical protein
MVAVKGLKSANESCWGNLRAGSFVCRLHYPSLPPLPVISAGQVPPGVTLEGDHHSLIATGGGPLMGGKKLVWTIAIALAVTVGYDAYKARKV